MEKKRIRKIERYAEKLRALPDLSDDERYLYAHSLAMTPDERWQANRNALRMFSSFKPSPPRKSRS